MSVKKIAKVANKFIAYLENGDLRNATEDEVSVHLASLAPGEKNGGVLEAVRLNEATGNAEYRYAHTDEKGNVSHKVYAKKVLAQHQSTMNQTEPVDGAQDEKKIKEEKPNVPRDEAKAKPEGNWEGSEPAKNPTEIREENYQRGSGGEDLHNKEVPRSKNNSGLEGSDPTSFAEEKADDATSGSENNYVQTWEKSEKPTPAGNEMNHAVAAENKTETREANKSPLNVEFSTDLMGMVNEGEKMDKVEASSDEVTDGESKIADSTEATSKETIEKSEDQATQEAKIDEDVANEIQEAKSQLIEANSELRKARAEINNYKIREARMKKAIEHTLVLQQISPRKYAETNTFLNRVADTVKKMDVEAIEVSIEEMKGHARELVEAQKEFQDRQKTGDSGVEGLQIATVVPLTEEGFSTTNKSDLAQILMENTSLGQKMAEFETYKPHEKSW